MKISSCFSIDQPLRMQKRAHGTAHYMHCVCWYVCYNRAREWHICNNSASALAEWSRLSRVWDRQDLCYGNRVVIDT